MANQWGRDSDIRSGGRRGSSVAFLIAMIFALALGAGGGYAAFRFMQSDTGAATDDVRAEVSRLNEALDAARQELDAAQAAQASDAARIDELNATIARQAGELDAMAEKLAASTTQVPVPQDGTAARERDALAAENRDLRQKLTALEAERDAVASDAAAEQERLGTEIAQLRDAVVPELTAERDQLQRKVSMVLADQANLKARAKAAAEALEAETGRIAELEARLAEAERELAASQEVLDALRLERHAEAAPDATSESPEARPTEVPADTGAQAPRDPDAVASALRTAPGLETLAEADRQSLAETLIAGECVTTALKSVFARVPILTLRNLIRDLNSDC